MAPLVSIGIPTYARGELLDRAIASALGQTWPELEVVISDNASPDDTPQRCARWAQADARVRVLRQPANVGPTANFNAVWAACRGDYVLSLSDDDHLDPAYVERCVTALEADPGLAVVAGRAAYERGGQPAGDGDAPQLEQPTAAGRLRGFFAAPGDAVFYGVARAEAVRTAAPMPNVLANDWLHGARLAAQGRVRTLEDVHVRRELGGTSSSIAEILATFGRGGWAARVPHLVTAATVFADIAWRAPVHRAAVPSIPRRVLLAARCAPGVIDWASLAWHLTAPTFLGLARRPRGRPVAAAYDRFTRALGAGQGG